MFLGWIDYTVLVLLLSEWRGLFEWLAFWTFSTGLSIGIGIYQGCYRSKQSTTQEFLIANGEMKVIDLSEGSTFHLSTLDHPDCHESSRKSNVSSHSTWYSSGNLLLRNHVSLLEWVSLCEDQTDLLVSSFRLFYRHIPHGSPFYSDVSPSGTSKYLCSTCFDMIFRHAIIVALSSISKNGFLWPFVSSSLSVSPCWTSVLHYRDETLFKRPSSL